jgi:hypothetical protein
VVEEAWDWKVADVMSRKGEYAGSHRSCK